jgi:hypothetical protein
MRHPLFIRFLLLIPALSFCSLLPTLFAEDPPTTKGGGKESDIAPPSEKDLVDKRVLFMKTALSRFTIQVGTERSQPKLASPVFAGPIRLVPARMALLPFMLTTVAALLRSDSFSWTVRKDG